MEDIKLFLIETFFFLHFTVYCFALEFGPVAVDYFFAFHFAIFDCITACLDAIDPLFRHGLTVFNVKLLYTFPQNMTFFFAVKFCLAIIFLILLRVGTPRYRYDYLTKLG